MVLDGDGGGADQRQCLRRGDLGPAGQVDGAEQRARGGVVHGRRGAAPRLHDAGEVLGAADLQFAVEGQRRARRVGPGAALAPVGAGHEVHRLGLAARVAVALDPQQRAVGGGDGDDDAGVGGVVDSSRRMTGSAGASGCAARISSSAAATAEAGAAADVGVDARGQAAPPALGDHAGAPGWSPGRWLDLPATKSSWTARRSDSRADARPFEIFEVATGHTILAPGACACSSRAATLARRRW